MESDAAGCACALVTLVIKTDTRWNRMECSIQQFSLFALVSFVCSRSRGFWVSEPVFAPRLPTAELRHDQAFGGMGCRCLRTSADCPGGAGLSPVAVSAIVLLIGWRATGGARGAARVLFWWGLEKRWNKNPARQKKCRDEGGL